jgi:hypothetical protein
MDKLTFGFWDITDQTLRYVGKGAAWFLKTGVETEESTAYAMIGGAVVWAVFGTIAGFALSGLSRAVTPLEAAVIGALFGVCVGIPFGAFVDLIDVSINSLLKSLKDTSETGASSQRTS